MRKTDWRAAETEIIDEHEFRRQSNPPPSDETIEKIAWLMDRSIPIGSFRIGLDPILGLVPGVGDLFSGLISAVLIVQAHRNGVSRVTVLRMVANVAIDSALGAVPLIGDIFDFAWKANSKNLELYRSAAGGRRDSSKDWGFLAILLLGLVVAVAIPLALAMWVFRAIF
jgi:hypothetical protein